MNNKHAATRLKNPRMMSLAILAVDKLEAEKLNPRLIVMDENQFKIEAVVKGKPQSDKKINERLAQLVALKPDWYTINERGIVTGGELPKAKVNTTTPAEKKTVDTGAGEKPKEEKKK